MLGLALPVLLITHCYKISAVQLAGIFLERFVYNNVLNDIGVIKIFV